MTATPVILYLADLLDVDLTGLDDEFTISFDEGAGKWVAVPFPTPVLDHGGLTGLADDDHPQYLTDARGDAKYQPLDSDLTAIAALSTTSFGRSLLALANQAALLAAAGAAAASHAHAGEDITTGTIADARIASTIARDSEVTAAVSAEATARDAAISAAISALVASAPGLLDTLDEIAAALGDDPNFATTMTTALASKQPLDSDLTAIAALSTTSFGRSLLTLADAAALLAATGAAAASHVHSGADITSGTVAEARIDADIARDSEVSAAIAALSTVYQSLDSDLTAIAALSTQAFGRSLLTLASAAATRAALDLEPGVDVAAFPVTVGDMDAEASDFGQIPTSNGAGDVTWEDPPTTTSVAAENVSVEDVANDFTATDVEGVLAELQSDHEADATALSDHISDATAAHAASAISNTPAGNIAATTLQAAIDELDSEKQPLDSDLTAFAGLGIAADKLPYGNGSHTLALADFTAAGRALLDDADASAQLTTLGLSAFIKTLVDDADAATARATLGVIASLFQAGGAQAIKLDDLATPDDNTDLNASTSAHGLLKKLDNDTTHFMRGDGAWAAPAGGGGSGETISKAITQTAHGLSVGNAVRYNGTAYVKAQADTEANAEVVGVVSAVADANNFTLVTGGRVTGLSSLTAGSVYYLDDDTAGLLTLTEPPDVGDISKPVLISDSTTSGWFFNMRGAIVGVAAVNDENLILNSQLLAI